MNEYEPIHYSLVEDFLFGANIREIPIEEWDFTVTMLNMLNM
jgi:hypothetical protein